VEDTARALGFDRSGSIRRTYFRGIIVADLIAIALIAIACRNAGAYYVRMDKYGRF
jgi:hypothetical protein